MTLPVATLIGRPNVGKSMLFNCLCGGRDALVGAEPGLTRDRRYGRCRDRHGDFRLVDVGGVDDAAQLAPAPLAAMVQEQLAQAIDEAALLLFVVSAREGLLPVERSIAERLRRAGRPWWLAINKIDGLDPDLAQAEFSPLAAARNFVLSSAHRRGIAELRGGVAQELAGRTEATAPGQSADVAPAQDVEQPLRVAVIGRPNAGKSTLLNCLLGERRMVVDAQPGATRDSIAVPLSRGGCDYSLVDTAGLRRHGDRGSRVERLAAMKALDAVRASDAVVLMVDATQGAVDQDLRLLGQVLELGRPLVLALSKWDAVSPVQGEALRAELRRRSAFADFVRELPVSAHSGHGIAELFRVLEELRANSLRVPGSATALNDILRRAVAECAPPLSGRHRIRLRYAHSGGNRPPCVVIHGSQASSTPVSYRRYLERRFRVAMALVGSPLKLVFRDADNPYADRPNRLTPRQQRRRRRLLRHVRKVR